jgi:surface antigen
LFTQIGGVHGTIVAGPQTATFKGTSYVWWQINWDSEPPNQKGVVGWSAEPFIAPLPTADVGDVPQPDLTTAYYTTSNPFFPNFAPNSIGGSIGTLGNCTWYAYGRLLQLGYSATQLNAFALGNASTWASAAGSVSGVVVDNNPGIGAIAQLDSVPNFSLGHVAIVEGVNVDGTITVTESSSGTDTTGAWDFLWRHRTVSPTWFSHFIHLTSASAPILLVSPSINMTVSGKQGGPYSPNSLTYQLSTTSGSINFQLQAFPTWLTPSITSATVATSPTPITFTINSNANGFGLGTFNQFISFYNFSNLQGSTTRAVTLSIHQTQSGRTFVSGAGSDSNLGTNCARTSPCRTLATALTVTSSGGEIVALDPAGYGPIAITGPLAIFGVPGAGISVQTNGTGITINASATDQIIINNLDITGADVANTTGIQLNSGQLTLQNSTLKQLTTGLTVTNTKANLFHVDLVSNTTGISASGTGPNTSVNPVTGPTEVLLFFGSAHNNATAYSMTNPGTNTPNILEFLSRTSGSVYTTSMAGNGTLISGSGSGCPCTTLGTFASNTNPN